MTFEDVKNIRQNPTMDDVDNKELSKMIDIALEKQIPKRVDEYLTSSFCCPVCTNVLGRYSIYCDNCGQALDWSDTE